MTHMEVIKAFDSLPMRDRIAIARQLKSKVLGDLFEELDAQMPDIEMSISEPQSKIQKDRDEQREKLRIVLDANW